MLIRIPKWEKHNPRKDYKSMPWFRCSSNLYIDPKLGGLDSDTRWLWICLLCIACNENKQGVIECKLEWLSHVSHVPLSSLTSSLNALHDSRLIELDKEESTNVTKKSRVRYERTNITNRTERTERTKSSDGTPSAPETALVNSTEPKTPGGRVWQAYSAVYLSAYGHMPVPGARANTLCAQLVKRLGEDSATGVVRFFMTHRKRWYVEKCHDLSCCVADAEALHTQMLAGHRVTQSAAQHADLSQGNMQAFQNVARKLAAEQDAKEKET